MPATQTRPSRTPHRRRVPAVGIRRIVLASAGEESSRGAIRLTRILAELHDATVRVIGATQPLPAAAMSALDMVTSPTVDEDNRLEVLASATNQVQKFGADWPVHASIGAPAETILDEAERLRASLIVMGLGRHKRLERLLGQETAIAVARRARVPVLAVPRTVAVAPSHAVVGVDFTKASLAAARFAAMLLPDGARLSLVHIPPFADFERRDGVSWVEVYATGAESRLAALKRELHAATRHIIDVAMLNGDPADALLRFAKRQRCDLMALGVHSQSPVERMLIGSTTTRILRGATCSVLVAPQRRTGAH